MDKTQSKPTLNRRGFLKLMGAAGATVSGGYLLYEYTPWLNYSKEEEEPRRAFEMDTNTAVEMREMVRYATLAPSGHNTQPWKFLLKDSAIEIHPDYGRRLPVVDPQDRELWISLGCALENLLLAARSAGYAAEVTYPQADDFIQVRLSSDVSQKNPLFDAIPLRQNTRSDYTGESISAADLEKVEAVETESGLKLIFLTIPTGIEQLVEYVYQGNLSQYADKAFIDELISWIRFNKKEALATLDGLYTRCTGNLTVPHWLGQMFVAGTKPQQQADADVRKLRSSPGAVMITTQAEDKASWVRTGQVYERLALTLTTLGIKSAFLNQLVEVADIRKQVQNDLLLGKFFPQLLVRFGYAKPLTRSLRRPVEQVIV